MKQNRSLLAKIVNGSLVLQILFGIIAGILVATFSESAAQSVAFLGGLFVGALKAIAPILVFILVAASIANQKKNAKIITEVMTISTCILWVNGTFKCF